MTIDLNSTTAFSDRLNWLIDAAQDGAEREKRSYLGASLIGGPCERQIQYQAMGTPVDEDKGFPPRILRCFDRGHWAESYVIKLMRGAGCILLDVDPATGKQWEFSLFGGRFAGHCDGIIPMWRGQGMAPFELPALWECKCLNSKSSAKAVKDKIRVSHPRYFNQVQLYMGEMGLYRCLFTILNADTMEMHHEMIDYEAHTHRAMVDRAQRILMAMDAGEMLVRGFMDMAQFACRYCDHSAKCWEHKA